MPFFSKKKKMYEDDMEDKENMQDEEEEIEDEDVEMEEEVDVEPEEPVEEEMSEMAEVGEKLDKLISMFEAMFVGAEDQEDIGEKPGTVAMQAYEEKMVQFQAEQTRQFAMYEKKIARLEGKSKRENHVEKLRMICKNAPHINFQARLTTLKKMPSKQAMEAFMEGVEVEAQTFPAHIAGRLPSDMVINEKEIFQEFTDKGGNVQRVAREAYKSWIETSTQGTDTHRQQFAAIWPEPKKFVDHVVSMEEVDPGYLKKMYVN